MKIHYAIIYTPGPNWDHDKPVYEQRLLKHGNYMSELQKAGKMVAGGPFTDNTGGMTVLQVESLEEAQNILDADPGVLNGVFNATIHPWHIVFEAA